MRCKITLFVAVLALSPIPGWAHPPVAEAPALFAIGLDGPEGLAFARDGALIVGSTTGEVRRYDSDGNHTVLANVGEPLAGITILRDGRVLAASFNASRVWSISPGNPTVLADGIQGANFIVQTNRGKRILCSASIAGSIVDITSGTPVPVISGLSFPNGMAIGRDRHLYIAETVLNRISRVSVKRDGSFGPLEVYATGLTLPDGIAFDRRNNLFVVGGGKASIVHASNGAVVTLSDHPAFDGPSNIAFGRGRGFARRYAFFANFGPGFGNGTSIGSFRTNHQGARLVR
jgi:sugar lactone lactonase YvrE